MCNTKLKSRNNETKKELTVEKTRKSDNVVVQESVVRHYRASQ